MDTRETGRVEAFSDGVFAVAITLLILNIQPPSLTQSDLLADDRLLVYLQNQWPMLLSFVTSFATIGVMWINHHKLFKRIKYIDTGLLSLNLLLLIVIVFIPYPTALLAQQFAVHPEGHVAALLYSGTNFVLAICFNLVWRYASHHHRLLSEDTDAQDVAAISRQYSFGPLVHVLTFGLAWINVTASVMLILLMALFFALPGRILPSRILPS